MTSINLLSSSNEYRDQVIILALVNLPALNENNIQCKICRLIENTCIYHFSDHYIFPIEHVIQKYSHYIIQGASSSNPILN